MLATPYFVHVVDVTVECFIWRRATSYVSDILGVPVSSEYRISLRS